MSSSLHDFWQENWFTFCLSFHNILLFLLSLSIFILISVFFSQFDYSVLRSSFQHLFCWGFLGFLDLSMFSSRKTEKQFRSYFPNVFPAPSSVIRVVRIKESMYSLLCFECGMFPAQPESCVWESLTLVLFEEVLEAL